MDLSGLVTPGCPVPDVSMLLSPFPSSFPSQSFQSPWATHRPNIVPHRPNIVPTLSPIVPHCPNIVPPPTSSPHSAPSVCQTGSLDVLSWVLFVCSVWLAETRRGAINLLKKPGGEKGKGSPRKQARPVQAEVSVMHDCTSSPPAPKPQPQNPSPGIPGPGTPEPQYLRTPAEPQPGRNST